MGHNPPTKWTSVAEAFGLFSLFPVFPVPVVPFSLGPIEQAGAPHPGERDLSCSFPVESGRSVGLV